MWQDMLGYDLQFAPRDRESLGTFKETKDKMMVLPLACLPACLLGDPAHGEHGGCCRLRCVRR